MVDLTCVFHQYICHLFDSHLNNFHFKRRVVLKNTENPSSTTFCQVPCALRNSKAQNELTTFSADNVFSFLSFFLFIYLFFNSFIFYFNHNKQEQRKNKNRRKKIPFIFVQNSWRLLKVNKVLLLKHISSVWTLVVWTELINQLFHKDVVVRFSSDQNVNDMIMCCRGPLSDDLMNPAPWGIYHIGRGCS